MSSGLVRQRTQLHFLFCRISTQLHGYKYKSTRAGKAIITSTSPRSPERREREREPGRVMTSRRSGSCRSSDPFLRSITPCFTPYFTSLLIFIIIIITNSVSKALLWQHVSVGGRGRGYRQVLKIPAVCVQELCGIGPDALASTPPRPLTLMGPVNRVTNAPYLDLVRQVLTTFY